LRSVTLTAISGGNLGFLFSVAMYNLKVSLYQQYHCILGIFSVFCGKPWSIIRENRKMKFTKNHETSHLKAPGNYGDKSSSKKELLHDK
jgi:hypothetical protein